jgi:cytochrome c-type biogenesis protein CcmH
MNRLARMVCIAQLAGVALLVPVASATAMDPPADIAFEARLKKLEGQLRCLVCQNQTLADSNADLADDLRREVRALASSGKSDDEIKAYLVARYGDFVLYNPPVKANTLLLWGGPFVLLVGGFLLGWRIVRARERRTALTPSMDPDAEARARRLLDGDAATGAAAAPTDPRSA